MAVLFLPLIVSDPLIFACEGIKLLKKDVNTLLIVSDFVRIHNVKQFLHLNKLIRKCFVLGCGAPVPQDMLDEVDSFLQTV